MAGDATAGSKDARVRLPYALAGAALVAFGGLFVTGERFLGVPILALLLVGSYATDWRLPPTGGARWMVRLVMFSTIATVVGVPTQSISLWYMKPEYTNLVGYLLAAELVVRAWMRPEPALRRQNNGIVLFLSALIITAASNTYDRQPMHTLGPFYMLLVVLSLRSMTRAEQADAPKAAERKVRGTLLALRGVALILALGLGFSVVFMLTRYENRLTNWAIQFLRQDKAVKGSSIGLNSAPHLRRIFNPQPSMERILSIDGSVSERHLRVMVFEEYKNRTWSPNAGERSYHPIDAAQLDTHQGGERLRVKILGDAVDILAVPDEASAVLTAGQLESDDLGSLREHVAGAHPTYAVMVQPTQPTVALAAPPDATQKRRALVIPEAIDQKVIDLARQVAGSGDPLTRVQKIQQYLRSHHEYSLSYDPGSDEPLNDFLLNQRAAHCQYFASAVAIMARAVGVPARLATGYYAHERFGDRQMIVRDRDAHAWAECWIEGKGWITVDATPSGGRPDVVFEDALTIRQWWEWLTDLPGRFRQWLGEVPRGMLVMMILEFSGIAVVIWCIRAMRKRRSLKMVDDGYAKPSEALVAAARRFERWLGQRDLPCAATRTWREHLLTITPQSPMPVEACMNFVEAYDRARFGGAAQVMSQMLTALDSLEQSSTSPGSTQHG